MVEPQLIICVSVVFIISTAVILVLYYYRNQVIQYQGDDCEQLI